MNDDVCRMLDQSVRLDEALQALFSDGSADPTSQRARLTLAMCQVAMEHAAAQRLLIQAGYHVTALALVRLQFEVVVRAVWLHHGASDDWVAGFSSPMAPQQLSEPIGSPPVDSMLQKIDATAPAFVGKMLRDFKAATWAPMNSYVHGGVRAVAQSLVGCSPAQLISVLRNANGLALMTANVFTLARSDPRLVGRIRQIQAANLDCLPPSHFT